MGHGLPFFRVIFTCCVFQVGVFTGGMRTLHDKRGRPFVLWNLHDLNQVSMASVDECSWGDVSLSCFLLAWRTFATPPMVNSGNLNGLCFCGVLCASQAFLFSAKRTRSSSAVSSRLRRLAYPAPTLTYLELVELEPIPQQ